MRMKAKYLLVFLLMLPLFGSLPYAYASPPSYTNLTNSNGQSIGRGHEQVHGSTAMANWTDTNGLSGFIFSANNTGHWINATWLPMTGTSNSSVFVYTANDTINNVDSFKFYANNTSNQWNTTSVFWSNAYGTATIKGKIHHKLCTS